ncbi:MAG: hypothetical protein SFY32_05015 [Bacteroidota bacterium]|nr:hypothetical protein [Bacteroidota bacterium]
MISKSHILIIIFLSVLSCQKKQYICPAYNSYFIHDDKERQKVFLPFHVDSLNESSTTIDNSRPDTNSYVSRSESETANKYQPKLLEKDGKKYQPNGIVINSSGKKKMRNVKEIEMTFINARPISQFSNVDSSSIKKNQETPVSPESETLSTDSL